MRRTIPVTGFILACALGLIVGCNQRPTDLNSRATPERYGHAAGAEDRTPYDGSHPFNWPATGTTQTDIEAATKRPIDRPDTDPTPGPLARDLGPGADGEKLGTVAHRPMPGSTWAPALLFTDTLSAGGDAATIATDVDDAAWTQVRDDLRRGRRPSAEQVRIEELINAFPYAWPAPQGDDAIGLSAATMPCPWAPAHRLARVALATAPPPAESNRPAMSLVFLIDVSGSMDSPERLPLAQYAMDRLVDRMREDDRVAIVTYAGNARIVLPPTDGRDRQALHQAIRSLDAGGGTHGSAGITTAYKLARQHWLKEGTNRVVLVTDGDFNVGLTGADELTALIKREAAAGLFLSAIGVGRSLEGDDRLEKLANQGNGTHQFLADRRDVELHFVDNMVASTLTVAQDAKIQVFFNPRAVAAWRLLGYTNRRLARQDFANDQVDGGEINAGHQVTALFEFVPLVDADPNPFLAQPNPLADDEAAARARVRWQPPGGGPSRLRDINVPLVAQTAGLDDQWAVAMAGLGLALQSGNRSALSTVERLMATSAGSDPVRQEVRSLVHGVR